jgi:type IV pilus assembly protein PilM
MANPVGIGIEIGEDEIRVVKLRRTPRGAVLQAMGSCPTPAGAVTGNAVSDPRLLAEGLRTAFHSYDIRSGWAVVGLPARAASSRVLELPVMAREEMTAVVAGEMEHYRMIPMNQGTFDFIPLGEANEETRRVPILVMAAEKRIVDGYREALRLAGMQMAALEPLSLAASRAVFPALEHGGVALLTIGARASELAIFHEGSLRYVRQIDVGALELAEENPDESAPDSGRDDDNGPDLPKLGRTGGNRQSLVYEIQRSLGFYHREAPNAARVERMIVCVDPEKVRDLKSYLESNLGLPANLGEPFKDTLYSDTRFNPDLLARVGPAYVPAMGCALRMIEDTPRAPLMDLSITGVESRMARVAPKWLIYALAASLLLVVSVLVSTLAVNRAVQKRQSDLSIAKQELVRVARQEQERTSAAKRAQEAQSIVQLRGLPWSDILFQVSSSMPERVWLTNLGVESGNTLALEGIAGSASSVATLMESLTRSPLFSGPQMSSITKDSSGAGSLVRYKVKVVLTPPTPRSQTPSQPADPQAVTVGGLP